MNRHHKDSPEGYPCSCGKPVDDPIHLPSIQPKPATGITKEWLLERAHLEEGCEIGAGCDKPATGERDYHDVPFPEGTQPASDYKHTTHFDERNTPVAKPASGEWTVYSVMKLRQKHWHEEDKNNAIAIAHNAAIAAAQPKPATGEWTVETIAVIRGRDGDFGLAAAINAALATERAADANDLEVVIEKLEKQLAAEVARREGIEQRLGAAFDHMVHDYQRQIKQLEQEVELQKEKVANLNRLIDAAQKGYISRLNELQAERDAARKELQLAQASIRGLQRLGGLL